MSASGTTRTCAVPCALMVTFCTIGLFPKSRSTNRGAVRVRRPIRILGDGVALGTVVPRVGQTFARVGRAYVLGKASLLIPLKTAGWSVLANNDATPIATSDPASDLSSACPDDLGEMARLMRRDLRVIIIVPFDLVVPLTHSAPPGRRLRYTFAGVIWKVFICSGRTTMINGAASALQGERPSIGRTCQLRRPAQ